MTSAMASLGRRRVPVLGRPLDKRHPYHLTYKAVIEHAARLARREERPTAPAALPLHRLFKDTPGYTSSAPSLAASSVSQLRGAA